MLINSGFMCVSVVIFIDIKECFGYENNLSILSMLLMTLSSWMELVVFGQDQPKKYVSQVPCDCHGL